MSTPLDIATLGPLAQSIREAHAAGRLGDSPEVQAFVQAASAAVPAGLQMPDPAAIAPAIDSARAKLATVLSEDAKQRTVNRAIQTQGTALAKALAAEVNKALTAIGSIQHAVVPIENAKDVTRHGVRIANLGGIAGVSLEFHLVFKDGGFRHWVYDGRQVDAAEIVAVAMRRCIFAYEDALNARRGRHP